MEKAGEAMSQGTMRFSFSNENPNQTRDIILRYMKHLQKEYNPISQIVGYIMSGDPPTLHPQNANLLSRVERDEIMEELLRHYLNQDI